MQFRPNYSLVKKAGFTLIELMIVVSIIGILAAIAIPKFADLVRKSTEAQTKGNLGTIRSALSVYYSDNEGQFPQTSTAGVYPLDSLTVNGKYLTTLPCPTMPYYHAAGSIECSTIPSPSNSDLATAMATLVIIEPILSGYSIWIYFADPTGPDWGQVNTYCVHTDTKGTQWMSY